MLSKNKLIIKFSQKKNLKKIQSFLNSHYRKKHILTKNTKLFKWYYFGKKINCSLAIKKNKIVGVYLYIPLGQFDKKLNSKKHIFGSLWSIKGFNEYSKKNKNRDSIAIALKFFNKTFELLKPKLIVAVGVDSRLLNFHKIKKYNVCKLDHHFILSPYVKNFKVLKNFNKLKIKKFKNINEDIVFKKINNINELKKLPLDNLFIQQIPLKSKTYLINRYLKHPSYKYHIYIVSIKKTLNLCVFRIINFKKTNIVRFVDYVGTNISFKNLKNIFYKILKIYKAEYLDFYSHGIPLNVLKQSGLKNKKDFKNVIIPNYFEPFVNKNVDIICAYKKLGEKGNIRIFKADGDQDRPNL